MKHYTKEQIMTVAMCRYRRIHLGQENLPCSGWLFLPVHWGCPPQCCNSQHSNSSPEEHLWLTRGPRGVNVRQWAAVCLCSLQRLCQWIRLHSFNQQPKIPTGQWRSRVGSGNCKRLVEGRRWLCLSPAQLPSHPTGEWLFSSTAPHGETNSNPTATTAQAVVSTLARHQTVL